jgi:hypothetical protein
MGLGKLRYVLRRQKADESTEQNNINAESASAIGTNSIDPGSEEILDAKTCLDGGPELDASGKILGDVTHDENLPEIQLTDTECSSRVPSKMVLRSANQRDENMYSTTYATISFESTHFLSSIPFTASSVLAFPEEMAESYILENENWMRAKGPIV